MSQSVLSWILPVCLALSAVSAGFVGPTETILQVVSLALLLSTGLTLAGKQFIEPAIYTQSSISALLAILFIASAFVSGVLAEDKAASLFLVAAIAVCMMISGGVWSVSEKGVQVGLERYCVLGTLGMGIYWIGHRQAGHRFIDLVHPNYWGFLCFGMFCLAGLVRSRLLSIGIRCVSVAIILDAQARGALLSTGVAAVTIMFFALRSSRVRTDIKALIMLGAAGLLSGAVLVFREQLYGILAQAFLIYDPYRGGTSGFSGRIAIWRTGVEVFQAHPWFGVGAGMGKYFFTHFVDLDHPHNGYLNTLDQFGAIGGGLFFFLAGVSVRRLAKLAGLPIFGSSVGIALVAGYSIEAIFEPKLVNIGNPVSIAFLMFLLQPLPAFAMQMLSRRSVQVSRTAKQRRATFVPANAAAAESVWESQLK